MINRIDVALESGLTVAIPADDSRVRLLENEVARLAERLAILHSAIVRTLDKNGHLADGNNCTLLDLKLALMEAGISQESEA